MFEKLLKSAFDSGGDVFVYMSGFNSPLRGRVQDMDDAFFTLFQNGKFGTILWAFRLSDVLSCGLMVGPPVNEEEVSFSEPEENVPYIEPDN
jgi:hypothetical protein